MKDLYIKILEFLERVYNGNPDNYALADSMKEEIGFSSNEKSIASFKYLKENGFIETIWNKDEEIPFHSKITSKGMKFLEKKRFIEKSKQFLAHPLVVAIITALIIAPISVYLTYIASISSINYEYESQNQPNIVILNPKQVAAEPDKNYNYNSIVFYNPSLKAITLQSFQYIPSEGWFPKVNSGLENNISKGQDMPELPTFSIKDVWQSSYKPYMTLEAGKPEQMTGYFTFHTPKEEGEYYIMFCAYTLDDKQFCSKDTLSINVRVNQTNLANR